MGVATVQAAAVPKVFAAIAVEVGIAVAAMVVPPETAYVISVWSAASAAAGVVIPVAIVIWQLVPSARVAPATVRVNVAVAVPELAIPPVATVVLPQVPPVYVGV